MIYGILDNDLYKFTMMQAVISLFPREIVRYKFINRGRTQFPDGFADELKSKIKLLSSVTGFLDNDSVEYLKSIRFLSPFYIDYLSKYKFDPKEVKITQVGGDVDIMIEGYWYRTILWEVPLLAIISETYYEMTGQSYDKLAHDGVFGKNRGITAEINTKKGKDFKIFNVKVADFGTRRRHSFDNHKCVIWDLKQSAENNLVGTSNVYMAKEYGIKAIGTMAHEWIMFHGAKYGFHEANKLALNNWVEVYSGDLGIALSDTYTTDSFFNSFDVLMCKTFDGVRHDSGDPIIFGEKVIAHYKKMGLDENVIKSKTIVFSDSLDFDKVLKIENAFRGRINTSYGIGTWLTNDIPGVKPLNIVIKMDSVLIGTDWVPAVKLSDEPGKYTGNKETIELAKKVLGI
jgi:nicotinate phosphoribosyltransferase